MIDQRWHGYACRTKDAVSSPQVINCRRLEEPCIIVTAHQAALARLSGSGASGPPAPRPAIFPCAVLLHLRLMGYAGADAPGSGNNLMFAV